jgi:hypothetical protein
VRQKGELRIDWRFETIDFCGLMSSLSSRLFEEIRPRFFSILAGANAPVYVDALEALANEMGEKTLGLTRQAAVDIVCSVVEHHAWAEEETDEGEDLASSRGRANHLLNRLIAAGWLSEPARADYQRIIHLEREGEIALDALRRIATPEAATFTDKLQIVCATLVNPEAFVEEPWSDLEACIANARLGLQELRGMQKSVERLTKRQLAAQTLRENLVILYDEFSEAIGHSCYRELVRVRLPVRVKQARRRLEEIERDQAVLERMQKEVMRRRLAEDPAHAMSHVRLRLQALFDLIEAIEPQAEEIDRRAADFARRSFARFRYLQEVGSARREQVQEIFHKINDRHAGRRISEIEEENFPELRIPGIGLVGGLESLYRPRRTGSAGEMDPIDDAPDEEAMEDCLREMESNLRDSLTALRANRFIESIGMQSGEKLRSADLPVVTDDDIADLAAVLLHAESADVRYRISAAREASDEAGSTRKAGYLVEDFEIEKK